MNVREYAARASSMLPSGQPLLVRDRFGEYCANRPWQEPRTECNHGVSGFSPPAAIAPAGRMTPSCNHGVSGFSPPGRTRLLREYTPCAAPSPKLSPTPGLLPMTASLDVVSQTYRLLDQDNGIPLPQRKMDFLARLCFMDEKLRRDQQQSIVTPEVIS